MIGVLQLSLGQGGPAARGPPDRHVGPAGGQSADKSHHWISPEYVTVLIELVEHLQLSLHVLAGHGEVGLAPVRHHPPPPELRPLSVHRGLCKLPGCLPQLGRAQPRTVPLHGLELNGEAVTVPARNVVNPPAPRHLEPARQLVLDMSSSLLLHLFVMSFNILLTACPMCGSPFA